MPIGRFIGLGTAKPVTNATKIRDIFVAKLDMDVDLDRDLDYPA